MTFETEKVPFATVAELKAFLVATFLGLSGGLTLTSNQDRLEIPLASVLVNFVEEKFSSIEKEMLPEAVNSLLTDWAVSLDPKIIEAMDELNWFIVKTKPEGTLGVITGLVKSGRLTTLLSIVDGVKLYARFLSTLFDLQYDKPKNERLDFDFWQTQNELTNGECLTLIWSGMFRYDKEKAFQKLKEMFTTKEAAKKLRRIAPWVEAVCKGGEMRIHQELSSDLYPLPLMTDLGHNEEE